MIRIKEESRKEKNIKEDVPVGTLLSLPAYILSRPFGVSFWIERNGRKKM